MNDILQPDARVARRRAARRSAARLRTEVRRHPGDRRDRARGGRSACGRGSATRRRASSPRSPRRSRSGRAARKEPLVLDGEIVALDAKGEPTGFQKLQGRIHLLTGRVRARPPPVPPSRRSQPARLRRSPVAFIAFDLLRDGKTDFRDRPLLERRAALERVFGRDRLAAAAHQRSGPRRRPRAVQAGARARLGRADRQARRLALQVRQAHARLAQAEDRPRAGVRHRRLDRAAPDARLLRRAAARRLRGRRPRLRRPHRHRLQRARARAGDEAAEAARNEEPVRSANGRRPTSGRTGCGPELVAQIKFTEWTADGKLRHPVYLGLRDDKKPTDVRARREAGRSTFDVRRSVDRSESRDEAARRPTNAPQRRPATRRTTNAGTDGIVVESAAAPRGGAARRRRSTLPDGDQLNVTNLHKVFWPKQKLTKGDLFRYYVARRAVRSCRRSPIGRWS